MKRTIDPNNELINVSDDQSLSSSRGIRDERGAALLLALGFLFICGMIVIALINWVGNGFLQSVKFQNASNLEYATSTAVQLEIQQVRYTYQAATSTPYNCTPGGSSAFSLNGQSVSVWCTVVINPYSAATRVVTMSSCPSSTSSASCVAAPYLQAVVSFDDYSFSDQYNCTSTANEVTCGTTMSLTSWVIG